MELLTAQPQAARDSAQVSRASRLSVAAEREIAALDRGVKMRTLYQHSARRHAPTRKYVAEVTAHGAEVRTLDEFFNRMIVIDRRLAIIPGAPDLSVAIAIREPGLVTYLVDVFERAWERARPFTNTERTMMNDIAKEQRAMTIRMLIEGHSDPVSAKRLGVSARTFAAYVADLKEEYDAETRFQLGYTMGQAGVSGQRAGVAEKSGVAATGDGTGPEVPSHFTCSRRPVGVALGASGPWGVGRWPCPELSNRLLWFPVVDVSGRRSAAGPHAARAPPRGVRRVRGRSDPENTEAQHRRNDHETDLAHVLHPHVSSSLWALVTRAPL